MAVLHGLAAVVVLRGLAVAVVHRDSEVAVVHRGLAVAGDLLVRALEAVHFCRAVEELLLAMKTHLDPEALADRHLVVVVLHLVLEVPGEGDRPLVPEVLGEGDRPLGSAVLGEAAHFLVLVVQEDRPLLQGLLVQALGVLHDRMVSAKVLVARSRLRCCRLGHLV